MLSGNVAMMLMLWFTSLGHFMFTKGMVMMMPSFIPFKGALVYLTGIMEIVLGALLVVNATRHIAGIILLVLFVVMLPANINAAMKHVDLEKATYDGSGPGYLWFRIPLQLLFIAWILYFSIGI
ncbi:hypothetical protein GCM10011500_02920 [Mucilaginibacter rubeus]|nr:hypothetical protein GCM10011500_02920 [Mucilaginibacter rubeus]